MAKNDELELVVEGVEKCPNCGAFVGDSTECENCGAVIANGEDLDSFEGEEEDF